MANKVQLKKSSVAARVPLTTDVDYGELALNYADGKLYYKKSDGTTIDHFPSVAYVPLLSGSYANPTWITSLDASKLTGTIDNARLNGSTYTINITGNAGSASAVAWSGITGKPTTLSAYGITDAYSSSNPAGYITSAALASYLPLAGGTVTGQTRFTGHDNQVIIDGTVSSLAAGLFFAQSGTNKWEQYHSSGRLRWYNYSTNAEEMSLDNADGFLRTRGSAIFGGKVSSSNNNGFANDVYYAGARNPIWSFGNASAYGISYFQGTAGIGGSDTIGIHPNGTPTSGGSAFSVTPAASYVNSNVVLHAGNYTSYAQATLVSGTNIKTVNGTSLLGSGDLTVSASSATYNQILDTRAGQYLPNDYQDYRTTYEFTNQIVGNDWHTAMTMQGWHNGYAAWQIIGPASSSTHENWYLRSGINTSWNSARTILHSGNYSSYALPLSGGTVTGALTAAEVYTNGWLRNNSSGTGMYNQATANHFYSDGQYWNVGYSGTTGIRLRNGHGGSVMGYLYGETSNNFGLLHNGGGWAVQVKPNGGGTLHGAWDGTNLRATRANGNFYIDDNYGNGIVGVYSSYRYQGVFAMGDSYKLPADGTTVGNLYGMAWSHPNAGGTAGNLSSHGLLLLQNGGFMCALSTDIRASGNVTAYSDERLKTNWRDMPEDFVARLARVKVGIYDRTDGDRITQVGVGAQSFQQLLPEAISTSKDEMNTLSVNYGGAALASAVELAKDNVELRARIERLEILISKLIGD